MESSKGTHVAYLIYASFLERDERYHSTTDMDKFHSLQQLEYKAIVKVPDSLCRDELSSTRSNSR